MYTLSSPPQLSKEPPWWYLTYSCFKQKKDELIHNDLRTCVRNPTSHTNDSAVKGLYQYEISHATAKPVTNIYDKYSSAMLRFPSKYKKEDPIHNYAYGW